MAEWNRRTIALFALVLPTGALAYLYSLTGLQSALDGRLLEWLVLFIITVMVGLFPVQIPGTRSIISITDAFIFTSVLFFGVFPSVVLAGTDALISTWRMTRRLSSNLFSFATMSLSVYLSACVFELVAGRTAPSEGVPLERLILPLGAMTLTHYIIDSGLVATATAFKRGKPAFTTWKDSFLWSSVTFFSGASAAAVLYIFISSHGLTAFGVVVPILVITYYTYKIYMEKVEEKNRHIREMSDVYLSTIEALTMAIDAKDQITYGHVRRVRAYTLRLGRLAGMSPDELEGIKAASLLHDIGKLAIPEYILNKPGKLTPGELQKMQSHPVIGAAILGNVSFPYPVIPMVRHHHERWDGTGYPDRLAGEHIPLGARVLAVADCYDALRSSRPYRHAMSRDESLSVLLEGSGTHFDPELVKLFIENIDELERAADHESAEEVDCFREFGTPEETIRPVDTDAAHTVLASISSAQREVLALYELAKVVGRSLSLRETMRAILDRVDEFLPHATCVLFLCEESSDVIRARAAQGLHAEAFLDKCLQLGEGATGWAIEHNRTLFNFDPTMDLDRFPEIDGSSYRCAAAFPLAVSDRVLGALCFYSDVENQYTSDHDRIMEIVTHQASMALLNSFIYEKTRTSALTDTLTGLPNSRYLDRAFKRLADATEAPFAVLVADLDGFKAVNDRHGHAAGDRLLEEVAEILQGGLRSHDVLARVGGDEFVVLLSETETDTEVLAIMHRLQASIDNHQFSAREGHTVRLGLSIGYALWPGDGRTREEMMAVADRRMYDNKALRKRHQLRMRESGRPRRISEEAKIL